jgi:hypothetical protein
MLEIRTPTRISNLNPKGGHMGGFGGGGLLTEFNVETVYTSFRDQLPPITPVANQPK